jgi:hypothetical protein
LRSAYTRTHTHANTHVNRAKRTSKEGKKEGEKKRRRRKTRGQASTMQTITMRTARTISSSLRPPRRRCSCLRT